MTNTFFKTVLPAMFTLTLVAATGCAAGETEDEQAGDENTGTTSEALRIRQDPGGGIGGGGALWCACKLDCDNAGGGPVVVKACKAQCDTDNKCRKEPTGGSGGVIMY